MKKQRGSRVAERGPDGMRAEYDFSKGRPNKYAALFTDTIAVVLAPDVAKRFRTARAVNGALRKLIKGRATKRVTK